MLLLKLRVSEKSTTSLDQIFRKSSFAAAVTFMTFLENMIEGNPLLVVIVSAQGCIGKEILTHFEVPCKY